MMQQANENALRDLHDRTASIDGCPADQINNKKLRYTTFVVRHPFCVQGCSLIVVILCALIIGAAGLFKISNPSENDYLLRTDERSQAKFKLDAAYEAVGALGAADSEAVKERSVAVDEGNFFLMFTDVSGAQNMLTAEGVAAMEEFQGLITGDARYEDFCLNSTAGAACDAPLSMLEHNVSSDSYTKGLNYLARESTLSQFSSLFFSSEFAAGNLEAENTRALLRFGLPLSGYASPYDDEAAQEERLGSYLYERHKDLLKQKKQLKADYNVDVYWYNAALLNEIFLVIVQTDFTWAIGSMFFVFLYMTFHMRSLFLAFNGILQVIFSFIPGFFIFRVVITCTYFQSLHLLAIFVILGIGADSVFVFSDAFNQMNAFPVVRGDLELRLALAFRRAAKMTLATSFTTFAAFMATGISKIMPIATFAYFAACIIVCNYALVVTFFTPALIVHHKYISSCCQRCRKPPAAAAAAAAAKKRVSDSSSAAEAARIEEGVLTSSQSPRTAPMKEGGAQEEYGPSASSATETEQVAVALPPAGRAAAAAATAATAGGGEGGRGKAAAAARERGNEESLNDRVQVFFAERYAPTLYRWRWPVVALFLAGMAAMAACAGQLKPMSEEEEFLPPGHFVSRATDLIVDGFQVSEYSNQVVVHMVWGVAGIDDDGINVWDPSAWMGEVIWDEDFDLWPEDNQEHLLTVCEAAAETDRGLLAGIDDNAQCFISWYKQWRETNNATFPASFDTRAEFEADLKAFVDQDEDAPSFVYFDPTDDSLLFVVMDFVTPINFGADGAVTNPAYASWEDFVAEMNAAAPSGADAAFQTGEGGAWAWAVTEDSLVQNLLQGMGLAMGCALATLLAATGNLVVAFLACFSICGIIACVLGAVWLQGWQLGITESISGVILIGFSVDYVVHISELYIKYGKDETRMYKTTQALKSMGITILAGAVTTFGSGVFLFGCTIIFFTKFAILICLTIWLSSLWSLGFLSTALMIVGPEGNTGNIKILIQRITGKNSSSMDDI